jgi:hypothetical protein
VSLDGGDQSAYDGSYYPEQQDVGCYSVCISHWRFRAAPLTDTEESLAAAKQRCDAALAAAVERRRHSDSSSHTWFNTDA